MRLPSPLSLLVLTVLACGKPQPAAESQRTAPGDRPSADATRRPGATPEAAAAGDDDGTAEDLDCGGIMLHEGHEHCDEDDVVAADDPEGTVDAATTDDGSDDGDEVVVNPPPGPPPPPADPNVVVFRIKAGTGSAPWNDEANPVQVKVGQTLRIVNDDTVRHRLHTNGAPCGHGANFEAGASFDCVVTRAYDSAVTPGGLYDHIAGTTARFYVKASP